MSSFLDLQTAAALVGCHPEMMRMLARERLVPSTKIGRHPIFSERLLREWCNQKDWYPYKERYFPPASVPMSRRVAKKKAFKGRIPNALKADRCAQERNDGFWESLMAAAQAPKPLPVKLSRPSNYHVAKRRSAKLRRTPAWADMEAIAAIYRECKRLNSATRIRYEVDHKIPLQGRTVSGLHVAENLQIITRKLNLEKHNKHSEVA